MGLMEAQTAIKLVAEKHGITYEQAISEIEYCILEAMQNPDPHVQERWKCIPCSGEKPTALEFIAYMRDAIQESP